ncbi:MAG: SDR family oxidoreductase [Gammaproteobacteria bacterium]|jgi:NAD(P)-dependent dehydrogenase (short-subunit alcohol dehydrogenase family)|nr:SDR family oxidoreductase [Gammaproteobacteria bacterium]
MSRVAGKVAIVTGAASNPGLGYTTALALAREGARLLVTDIDEAGAEACAAAIRDAGGEAHAARQDVTSEADWQATIELATAHFGRLDVLVNNAGIAILKPLAELTLADWNRQIEVNMTSVFLGCKYAMSALGAGGGSIVNLSSVAGLIGIPTCTAYGAAKGGVRLLTKTVALEGAPAGVRCNSVHPGMIWTNMQSQAAGSQDAASVPVDPQLIPLGRMGTAEDIANCVLYLASDESSYVTGAEFTVDAGMTAR